jgi:hypothetical protein
LSTLIFHAKRSDFNWTVQGLSFLTSALSPLLRLALDKQDLSTSLLSLLPLEQASCDTVGNAPIVHISPPASMATTYAEKEKPLATNSNIAVVDSDGQPHKHSHGQNHGEQQLNRGFSLLSLLGELVLLALALSITIFLVEPDAAWDGRRGVQHTQDLLYS